jgi:hypothetical protein
MGDSDAASDAGSDLAAVKLEGGEEEGTAALLEGDAPLAPAGEDEGTAALLEQPAAAAAPPGDPGAGPSLEAHAAAGEEADEGELLPSWRGWCSQLCCCYRCCCAQQLIAGMWAHQAGCCCARLCRPPLEPARQHVCCRFCAPYCLYCKRADCTALYCRGVPRR